MTQQAIFMIAGFVGIFALGLLYGFRIGKIGIHRSWSLRKIRKLAAFPFLIAAGLAIGADLVFRVFFEGPGPEPFLAKFPWSALILAAFLAMFAAAKGAGIPWDEFRYRDGKISDRKKNDLSIT